MPMQIGDPEYAARALDALAVARKELTAALPTLTPDDHTAAQSFIHRIDCVVNALAPNKNPWAKVANPQQAAPPGVNLALGEVEHAAIDLANVRADVKAQVDELNMLAKEIAQGIGRNGPPVPPAPPGVPTP